MVTWTAETHETLLVAIIASGFIPNFNTDKLKEVIAAWPANKGPAPSVSALSQHLNGLRKKVNGGASAASTPRSARTKTSTPTPASTKKMTGTFGNTPTSRDRPSASKRTLFDGVVSKRTKEYNAADAEGSDSEGGDDCPSDSSASSPNLKTGFDQKAPSSSTLGKRDRRSAQQEEVEDSPVTHKGLTFIDQLKAAAAQPKTAEDELSVKKEPEWDGYYSPGGSSKKAKTKN